MSRVNKIIELWASNNAETHGGENNGSARTVLCPASGKNAFAPTLDSDGIWRAHPRYEGGAAAVAGFIQGGTPVFPTRNAGEAWLGTKAFGDFWSDNPADPVIGSTAGTVNQFDYVTGMPDMRWEHIHVIDCDGFDYLSLSWKGEVLDYEGLAVDPLVAVGTDNHYADDVYIAAWGVDVVDPTLDYVNYPVGMWMNANDTLDREGRQISSGSQSLTDSTFSVAGIGSWSVTGDFAKDDPNNEIDYADATHVGTLTQAAAAFAVAVQANRKYVVVINVVTTGFTGALTVSGICGSTALASFTASTAATQTFMVGVTAQAVPGDFVITAASSGGSFVLDGVYLYLDSRPGGNNRPRPFFSQTANTADHQDPFIAPFGEALVVTGNAGFTSGGTATGTTLATSEMPTHPSARIRPYAPAIIPSVARGMLQYGRTWRHATTGMTRHAGLSAGDRLGFRARIGLPPGIAAYNTSFNNVAYSNEFRITGLARIYLLVMKVGLAFTSATPGGTAAGSNPATMLISTPVAPATAPRQHIKGRLYAKLVGD